MLIEALFYVFGAILIAAALGVISARNPVYSALALVMCFLTSAAIWLLLEAEFLAVVLVLVYVGAVMVLFLFVVMMLDIDLAELRQGFTRFAWLGWLTALAVIVEIVGVVWARGGLGIDASRGATPEPAGYSNTLELGRVLYTRYAYPLELAAMLLLVAIVAAIALTMRHRPGLKYQDVSRQVAVRREQRLRIVKMDAENTRDHAGAAADAVGNRVLARDRRDLPQPQEHDPAADVRRAAAARGELQLHRLLALSLRHQRPGVRVLRAHRGRGRVGDRPGDPGGAVQGTRQHQRRRSQHAEGLTRPAMNPTVLIAIPLLPLLAAIVAGLGGRLIGRAGAHWLTCGAVAASCGLSFIVLKQICLDGVPVYDAKVYTWLVSDGLHMEVGFLIDRLTALMMAVVTFVSLCVHVYTIGYMSDDPGYTRFFSYISLFTFSMLMLVMANNFLQLFFGWEAVGLVSYLLIGFWYTRPSAIFANLKAFIVNRIGDFGFVLGIAAIAYFTRSLAYRDAFAAAPQIAQALIPVSSTSAVGALTLICICLFIGAMGKSAQVPLHVWLPDSMEGPTPISALIHAATMVTAGIFMVARMSPLFEYSDAALSFVLVIGATTAFFMGLLGVVNNDRSEEHTSELQSRR